MDFFSQFKCKSERKDKKVPCLTISLFLISYNQVLHLKSHHYPQVSILHMEDILQNRKLTLWLCKK